MTCGLIVQAAFLIASWLGLQHAAKVVLVEVESISITSFISYCPLHGKPLAILNIFFLLRSNKGKIGRWLETASLITWEDLADVGPQGGSLGGLADVAPIGRELGERGTDREVAANLGGTEQRSIMQFCSLTLDNWTLL